MAASRFLTPPTRRKVPPSNWMSWRTSSTRLLELVRCLEGNAQRAFQSGRSRRKKRRQSSEALGAKLAVSELMGRFSSLLARKNRLPLIGEIREAFSSNT